MTLRILSLFASVAFLAVAIWASQRESAAERNERLLHQAATLWSTQLGKPVMCSEGNVSWAPRQDGQCWTVDKP